MTRPTSPSVTPNAPSAESAAPDCTHTAPADAARERPEGRPAIAPFSFPFSPGEYASKKDARPWHQKDNKSSHDQRPGLPPKGSSKSMGKR